MSKRTIVTVSVLAGLVVAYFVVTSVIRAHVTEQIQKSAGQPLPDFRLVDRSGKTWAAGDLRGKTTVLNFFRSRCHNCLMERDVIHALAKRVDPAKARVLGVMMDRVVSGIDEGLTKRTLQRMAYDHPILMADAAFVDAFHGVGWAHVTPVTYIVDANGMITHAFRNHQTLETLLAAVH